MPPTSTLPEIIELKPREPACAIVGPPAPARAAPPRQLPGTRSGWAMRCVYLVSDLVAFGVSLAAAKLTAGLLLRGAATVSVLEAKFYLLWIVGLVVAAAVQQTYAAIPPRPVRKFRGWVLGVTTVCLAIVAGASLLGVGASAWYATLMLASGLAVLAASFCRAVCRMVFGSAAWWGTRLVVVGGGGVAEQTCAGLEREPQWGLRPVGYVDDGTSTDSAALSLAYLGTTAQLDQLAEECDVDWGLVAVHSFDAQELSELLARPSGRIKHWIILPPLERFPSLWLEACEAARRPALTITNRLRQRWSWPVKRAFDFCLAVMLGLCALPLIALVTVLIRLGSPGPAFYGQERVGRFGRRFKLWKFRTMFPDADSVLSEYLSRHPDLAEQWRAMRKLRPDPRVTWIGRWLRSTSLDELPQIWNVIVGDMSLVGPRPIEPHEIEKFEDDYEHYVRMLPGITGLWQVSGRSNTTYEERVALDVYYVQNWSLWLDVYILACTAKVVLLCEGAY